MREFKSDDVRHYFQTVRAPEQNDPAVLDRERVRYCK
jgi:hypothetical protein